MGDMADFTNEVHEQDNYIIDTSSIYSIRAEFDNVCFGWEEQRAEKGSARQKATNEQLEYIHYLIIKVRCTVDDAVWHRDEGATDNLERKNECGSAVKNLIEQINKMEMSDD